MYTLHNSNRRCSRPVASKQGCTKYCWQHAYLYIPQKKCVDDDPGRVQVDENQQQLIQYLQQTIQNLRLDHKNQVNYQSSLDDYQRRIRRSINHTEKELDRLAQLYQTNQTELDELRIQYNQCIQTLEIKESEFQLINDNLQQCLENQQRITNEQKDALEIQANVIRENMNNQYEQNINEVKQNLQDVQQALESKTQLIDQGTEEYRLLVIRARNAEEELQSQLTQLQNEFENERRVFETQIQQLEQAQRDRSNTQIETINQLYNECEEKRQYVEDMNRELNRQLTDETERRQNLQQQILQHETEKQSYQDRIQTLDAAQRNHEMAVERYIQRIDELEEMMASIDNEKNICESTLNTLTGQIDMIERQHQNCQTDNEELRQQLRECRNSRESDRVVQENMPSMLSTIFGLNPNA